MTMRWLLWFAAIVLPLTTRAAEPLMLGDPYAKAPPATLSSWPPLYHLPPGDKPFYYAMGWCGVQHHGVRYDAWYRSHAMLEIDALPETSWQGVIVTASATQLTARDADGQSVSIVLHSSPTVTELHLVGPTDGETLRRGVWARFVGTADRDGHIAAPVSQLEIYTPRPADRPPQVAPDQLQTISGRLIAIDAKTCELRPASRSRFNAIGFTLADDARFALDVAQFELAKPGQKIDIRGRLLDVAAQVQERAKQTEPGFFAQVGALEDPGPVTAAAPTTAADDAQIRAMKPIIFACWATIELGLRPNPAMAGPKRPLPTGTAR